MTLQFVRFLSLLFAALAFAPAAAHLLELANKIGLPRDEYFTVQRIYQGWALLGVVVVGALFSTLMLTVMSRQTRAFRFALIAFLAIVATQVVFWTFTFPANRQTANWTYIPDNWESLRSQWEYSHATSAVLNLIAFISAVLAVLVCRHDTPGKRGQPG
jgi:ABC-type cobalamin transport system permease subunit